MFCSSVIDTETLIGWAHSFEKTSWNWNALFGKLTEDGQIVNDAYCSTSYLFIINNNMEKLSVLCLLSSTTALL
jgi:hypothetical protein